VLEIRDEPMERIRAAIENPYAPEPSFDDIFKVVSRSAPVPWEDLKSKILAQAPQPVRNFYANIRTPRGAEMWMRLAWRYPKHAERFLAIMKQFVPFIEPLQEFVAENEYRQNLWSFRTKALFDAATIHNTIYRRRQEQIVADAENLISSFSTMTLENATQIWASVQRFTGTPVYNKVVAAYTAELARVLAQAEPLLRFPPDEKVKAAVGERVKLLKEVLPPNIYETAGVSAQNVGSLQQMYVDMLQNEINILERDKNNLARFGIHYAGRVEPILNNAKEALEAIKEGRFGSVEELLRAVGTIKTAINDAKTAVGDIRKEVSDFVSGTVKSMGSTLSILGRAPAKQVDDLLKQVRSFSPYVGGKTIASVLADEKGMLTFDSKIQILDEMDERLDGLITVARETGMFNPEPFIELKSQIALIKLGHQWAKSLADNFFELIESKEFKEYVSPNKLKLLEERRKAKMFPVNYTLALQRLRDLQERMKERKVKFSFDLAKQMFSSALQYFRSLLSLNKQQLSQSLSDEDELRMAKRLLETVNLSARPEIMMIYGGKGLEDLQDRLRERLANFANFLQNRSVEAAKSKTGKARELTDQEYNQVRKQLEDLLSLAAQWYQKMDEIASSAGIFPAPAEAAQQGAAQGIPNLTIPVNIQIGGQAATQAGEGVGQQGGQQVAPGTRGATQQPTGWSAVTGGVGLHSQPPSGQPLQGKPGAGKQPGAGTGTRPKTGAGTQPQGKPQNVPATPPTQPKKQVILKPETEGTGRRQRKQQETLWQRAWKWLIGE
jgi:hypothetical protein